jgi:phosphatidylglycerophosphate synthase
LDGYLARKWNQVTDLGKFLDPIADKLLVNSVLVFLAVPFAFAPNQIHVPVFCVILMIGRDLVVDALRFVAAKKNYVIAANMFGKAKTVAQMIALPFIFLNERVGLSLTAEVPAEATDTVNMRGTRWFYDSMVSEEDWMGQQLLQLRFISPQGHAYRYSTGRPMTAMTDTTYHPALAIMYPEELIRQTDSLLRARTFYILYNDDRIFYPADSLPGMVAHQKFVPVRIDSVSYGTETAPLRVAFTKGDEQGYFLASLPGSRQNATSTPLTRYLSMTDPYDQHPDITSEIWSKIQYSQVQPDMTAEEVRLSWGRPSRVERGPSRNGVVEFWYYSNNRILQFWDGRLSKIGIL